MRLYIYKNTGSVRVKSLTQNYTQGHLDPVYMISFFTSDRIGFISDWLSVYTKAHKSDMPRTVLFYK